MTAATLESATGTLTDPRHLTGEAATVWQLIERAQTGDAAAFGELYERYVDMIFRFVYFRTGNQQNAEDITSEVFCRAMNRIDRFSWQGRDIGAWLITIARNIVADHFKSARHRLDMLTPLGYDGDRPDESRESRPEEAALTGLANDALKAAITTLNPEQRQCIELRFLQGKTVAETAAAMDKAQGAIKALTYRAVRTLRRKLEAVGTVDR